MNNLCDRIREIASSERPALACVLACLESVDDNSKTAWENKYCDYHDCFWTR
ncbi:MAG: hypothetical protein AABY84_08785 [Candidatus Firestonebacteria bacterium]